MAPDPLLSALGSELKRARISSSWTIRETASRADLSARFVSDIEQGRANVSVLRLARLARVLGIRLDALFAAANQRDHFIALLGLRGAGKSTIGRQLAAALDVEFVELTALVEQDAGLTLDEIFTMHGEAYFRELELEALRSLIGDYEPAVLATSGGIVTEKETFSLLRDHCTTVWLKADPEDHWERVIQQGDQRPMADNPGAMDELRTLLRDRALDYNQAEITVDTSQLGIDGAVELLRGHFS